MNYLRVWFVVFFLCFSALLSFNAYADYSTTLEKINEVLDVSGDNYFKKAVHMIQHAQESVVMSMFLVEEESEQVMTLLEELNDALARGLKVELYINTRYNADEWAFLNNYFYASPRKAIDIYPVGENHFLHHKLIIIDEKTVLEGSINWSRDYDKDKLEYALLVEDELLAQNKILYLHQVNHAKYDMENKDLLWRSQMAWIKPSVVDAKVPARVLTEDDLVWKMIERQEYDNFDLYLMLLHHAALVKSSELDINYSDLAYGLKINNLKEKKQKKIIYKKLRKLQKMALLKIESHNKTKTKVRLAYFDLPSFTVPLDILAPDFVRLSTYEFKTAYLMCALLNDIYNRTKDLYTQEQREHLKTLLGSYKLAPIPPVIKSSDI